MTGYGVKLSVYVRYSPNDARILAQLPSGSKSMARTYGLKSAVDLFAKLQRDAEALNEQVNSDRLFNFVVTGYSMIDWIKNDPSVPLAAKAEPAVQGLYSDRHLKICGELANASKHFTLSKCDPVTASANSSRGWGVGSFGKGNYGTGEEEIVVLLSDGTKLNAIDLVNGVIATWKSFFSVHHIKLLD